MPVAHSVQQGWHASWLRVCQDLIRIHVQILELEAAPTPHPASEESVPVA